jgi:transposase
MNDQAQQTMGIKRHELSDIQWQIIEPLMPKPSKNGGRPWRDHRMVINGILWKLNTGAQWRDVPERYGPWETLYERFNRWSKSGLWAEMMSTLLAELRRRDMLETETFNIDATYIRASRSAAGARKKGTRESPPITRSAAPEAVSAPRRTSSSTPGARR